MCETLNPGAVLGHVYERACGTTPDEGVYRANVGT